MKLLIIEPDTNFQALLKKALVGHFKRLELFFESETNEREPYPADLVPDLALVGTPLPGVDLFAFLNLLEQRGVPFILMGSNPDLRLVIEGMRAGALDFILKNKFDTAIFVGILKRALLEGDRWQEIRRTALSLPPRRELSLVDRELKSLIRFEKPASLSNGVSTRTIPQDGTSYNMTFITVQLSLSSRLAGGSEKESLGKALGTILDNVDRLETNMGGNLWARHEDSAIHAFIDEDPSRCIRCAMKLRGYLNSLTFTLMDASNKPTAALAVASSETIYREDKNELYSEALNLTAHIAMDPGRQGAFVIDGNFYEQLQAKERKYFRFMEEREGHSLYRFEYIR